MKVILTERAKRELSALPKEVAKRIAKKLAWYASQQHPLSFAKHLMNSKLGSYRFRIGNYRIICDVEEGVVHVLLVLTIRKRDHAYDGI